MKKLIASLSAVLIAIPLTTGSCFAEEILPEIPDASSILESFDSSVYPYIDAGVDAYETISDLADEAESYYDETQTDYFSSLVKSYYDSIVTDIKESIVSNFREVFGDTWYDSNLSEKINKTFDNIDTEFSFGTKSFNFDNMTDWLQGFFD